MSSSTKAIAASAAKDRMALSPEAERRRGALTFLTWAFFLSEAFKGAQAEASGLKAGDDVENYATFVPEDGGVPQAIPIDPSQYAEWTTALPTGSTILLPNGMHGALPTDESIANVANLDDGASRPVVVLMGGGGGTGSDADGGSDGGGLGSAPIFGDGGGLGDGFGSVGISLSLAGIDLDVGLGDGLDIGLGLSLPVLGDTLENILGSPVLLLDDVTETTLTTVSDLAETVTSIVSPVTSGLLGDLLGSDGLLDVTGGLTGLGGNDLFAGGKYTDYHLSLQADEPGAGLPIVSDVAALGSDLGDLAGGLIAAIGPGGHDTATSAISLPSAVDDLLLRGTLDFGI